MTRKLPPNAFEAYLALGEQRAYSTIAKQFGVSKRCVTKRAAQEGWTERIKKIEADASKLPKQLQAALDKAGPGRAVGPMRVKSGIQLLAYCGSRKLTPPKPKFEMPTRQQVENALINEKYDGFEEDYLKTARNSVYIEYRDNSYSQ